MTLPRVGVGLPIVGPHASPAAILAVAAAADRLGFSSLSDSDRILLPAAPGWTNDYGLPEHPSYDAIEVLTWLAGQTRRVKLMTGTLNSLYQPPVILARRLATLDHLSGGRVVAGIAQGWLPEEFAAVGVPLRRRGAGFEEHLAVMRACWGPDPVECAGPRYPVPRANIGPKPVNGHLPVLIGGLARPAIERAARLGDGLVLAFRDWPSMREQIAWYRDAGGTGEIVLRAGPMLASPLFPNPPTTWSEPSMLDDLARAAAEGVTELSWDLNIVGLPPVQQIEAMTRLAESLPA